MRPVGAWAAFIAGLASFLSPCVLPLVPGYISFISGLSLEELTHSAGHRDPWRPRLSSVFFVLGFTAVFTALGASASAVGRLMADWMPVLSKLAGALIVVFGLHTAGIVPIRLLYYEKRLLAGGAPPGYAGAFLMGLAFACGWTPCIGPILAAILTLAATQKTVAQGVLLLFVYSTGLGIPFILTGFGVNAFLQFFARYKRYIRWGEFGAGLLLVAVGVLVFTNRLSLIISLLPHSLFRFAL
jgi:cytochrome c-type biogenesis protein